MSSNVEKAVSTSRALTIVWLAVSAGIAYPMYSILMSWGFNQGLAVTIIFVCVCLLYDIPYRARKNAEHQAAMIRTDRWRTRNF